MFPSNQDISSSTIEPGSFRDPSGFIFTFEEEIYRAIAPSYFEHFSLFTNSGLYKSLLEKKLIIEHVDKEKFLVNGFPEYKIIKAKQIPFVSYPYEWSFSQLKDAALLTLEIQKESLKHQMILKDASAYNVQFNGSQPVFIDTLSFEKYKECEPWKAYGQFCRHFLAPLALMSYTSVELSKLLADYIDGIPLELASLLLPRRAKFLNSGIAMHIAVHARMEKNYSSTNSAQRSKINLPKKKLLALLQHLEECISGLQLKKRKSSWLSYNSDNSYSKEAVQHKEKTISNWLKKIKPEMVWDVGCNTGKFSLLASNHSDYVLAMDADDYCMENFYCELKKAGNKKILPLKIDLSNPSPSLGWANEERKNISQRGKADALLALALLHHLRIGNNVPFAHIANYFSVLAQNLIIEFIPKDDGMIHKMLKTREDIFSDYTEENFRNAFETYFTIHEREALHDSGRILYLMNKK
ncbi:MAG: SAM-dependent methyltransferase [Bacteroidetes bacterium]|nr:SAM-dependent methyltransferase [Bacteroidota bacterium]